MLQDQSQMTSRRPRPAPAPAHAPYGEPFTLTCACVPAWEADDSRCGQHACPDDCRSCLNMQNYRTRVGHGKEDGAWGRSPSAQQDRPSAQQGQTRRVSIAAMLRVASVYLRRAHSPKVSRLPRAKCPDVPRGDRVLDGRSPDRASGVEGRARHSGGGGSLGLLVVRVMYI